MQLCQSGVEKGFARTNSVFDVPLVRNVLASIAKKSDVSACSTIRQRVLAVYALICCSVAPELVAVLIILGEVPHVAVECTNAAVLAQREGASRASGPRRLSSCLTRRGSRMHGRYTERRADPPTGPTANELGRPNGTHIVSESLAQQWACIQEVEDSEAPLSEF